ncbi:hypothetical protein [Stenomitos frigidus]|nr:hypothetical protein [Stenomitos frigidus]
MRPTRTIARARASAPVQGRVVKGPPQATAAETLLGEKTGVGIDVCPARLDVYLRPQGPTLKVPHTEAGVRTLLGQRQPTPPPRRSTDFSIPLDSQDNRYKRRR